MLKRFISNKAFWLKILTNKIRQGFLPLRWFVVMPDYRRVYIQHILTLWRYYVDNQSKKSQKYNIGIYVKQNKRDVR